MRGPGVVPSSLPGRQPARRLSQRIWPEFAGVSVEMTKPHPTGTMDWSLYDIGASWTIAPLAHALNAEVGIGEKIVTPWLRSWSR